ncbi:MAG TPA: 16S rRNA (adenine(1518)-N(6)/adenine(1519)-N(6))-dimethyltransferase RsmA [Ignavibacteria bacterium]
MKIYPKKSLGQNYLTDENISRNIVNLFDVNINDSVLEIGPGHGALTKYLSEKTNKVVLIELDRNNCSILEKKFPKLRVINKNFLEIDLKKISELEFNSSNFRVIGNIPYNITSEIIFKLIDNRNIISDAQLMIQAEVAKRLIANPGSKEYGIPSVLVQVFSRPKLLFKVSRNCFYPKPNVDSRIIYFDFTHRMEGKINDIAFFKKFVKAAFGTRRKTLKNSLKKLNIDTNKTDFDFSRRAETLTVDEFISLSNLYIK